MSVWGLPVPVLKQWKGSKRRQVSTGGTVVSKNRLISVTMRPQWEGLLFYGAKTADSATCSECEYAPAPFPSLLQTVPTVFAILYRTITLYVIKFNFCFINNSHINVTIYKIYNNLFYRNLRFKTTVLTVPWTLWSSTDYI